MNPRHLEILQHALGLDKYGQGSFYRNRFVTGPGSDDFEHCCDLVEAGYMARAKCDPAFIGETNELFYVTEIGVEQVKTHSPKPPKLTRSQARYRRYLNADASMPFR